MNRSYRLVLNEFTQTWVAVAEIAKGRGKRTSSATVLTVACALCAVTFPALAAPPNPPDVTQLPTGGQVVAGQATVQQAGSNMNVIQSSNRAAVDWATFNVGSQAQVNFIQPDSAAAILNRVLNPNPSQIFGRINANGQVFLTNPSGIYFGPSASANVGALTATTHSVSNADFMAGRLNFFRNGASGKVENEGNLTAGLGGYIALLAPEVRNNGIIVAQMGTVAMAAGEVFELRFDGSRLANVRVEPATIAALVENGNAVQAPEGLVILSARAVDQLQGSAIRNRGDIEARGLVDKGGRIVLEADHITLANGSRLDASGATGGGEVLVGGGWQGSGGLYQATTVTMEQAATINVSATKGGTGGTAVLWSDINKRASQTRAYGSIWAKGGAEGGDGGRIETSGHWLSVTDLNATTFAPKGLPGEWLLDPYNITIANSVPTGTTFADTNIPGDDNYISGLTSSILATDIAAALGNGNVIIQTGGNTGDGQGNGDITIASSISKNSSLETTLTLKAHGSIIQNASTNIESTGSKLNVVLWADSDGSGDGSIWLQGKNALTTAGGGLWLGGGSGISSWAPYQGAPNNISVGSGYAIGNSANANGIEINGGELASQTYISTSGGNIAIYGKSRNNAPIYGRGDGVFVNGNYITLDSSTGTIVVEGVSQQTGETNSVGIGVEFYGTNQLVRSSAPVGLDAISIQGTGSTAVNQAWSVGVLLHNDEELLATGGGNIKLTGIGGGVGQKEGLWFQDLTSKVTAGPGDLSLNANAMILDGRYSGTGQLTIQSVTIGTPIDIAGPTGNLALTAANFVNNFIDGFSSVTIGNTTSGSITVHGETTFKDNTRLLNNSNVAFNGLIIANENLTISSNGIVTQNSPVLVSGATNILVGANSVVLNNAANHFSGGLSLSNYGNFNVTLRDSSALQLGIVSLGSGMLTVQTDGTLTQTNAITQEANAAGIVFNAGTNDITLSDPGNNFTGPMSVVNAKNIGIVNSLGLTLGSISTSGDISIATIAGDLKISQNISTSSTGTSAIVLNADRNATASVAEGGNIVLGAGPLPTITTGGGGIGIVQLLSGTLTGSASLKDLAGVTDGSGRFRYGSDETTKSYSDTLAPLVSGVNVIYREQPTLTLTTSTQTITYGERPSLTTSYVNGLVNGDTHLLSSSVTDASNNSIATNHIGLYNAGRYFVRPESTASALGYAVSDTNTALTVLPKAITISGITAASKEYDALTSAAVDVSAASGWISGDNVGLAVTGSFGNKNVGTAKTVTLSSSYSGSDASNYTITDQATASADITPKALTIKANDDAKFVTQPDATSYNGVSYIGLIPTEGADVLSGVLVYSRTNASVNAAGDYIGVLAPSGLTSNNYAISYINGNYTIAPADRLLVSVQNAAYTYGSTPTYSILSAKYLDGNNVIHTLAPPSQEGNTFSYSDGVGGTAVFTLVPQSAQLSTAGQIKSGTYDFAASNVTETSANFDNNLVVVGAMTVDQRQATASSNGATKVYDGGKAINNLAIGLNGLLPNDLATVTGDGEFSQKNVGVNLTYSVGNVSLGGVDASNYFLTGGTTVVGTNGSITPKTLSISGITALNKAYDGNVSATVSTSGVTPSVLVAGGMISNDVVQVTSTGTFSDKNAAIGKTVALHSVYSGADAGNYTITDQASTIANITPKALTIIGTSAVDKTYDGNKVASILPGTLTGFVGTEQVTATAIGIFDSKDAGLRSANASYTLIDGTGGGLASNYTLNDTSGHVATISKAELTVTADNKARLFGQPNPTFTTSVSGFVNGETASTADGFVGSGSATTLADVSTPAGISTITASAGSLSATNYDFMTFVDGVLTIQSLQAVVVPPKMGIQELSTPETDPPRISNQYSIAGGVDEKQDDDQACNRRANKTNKRCKPTY